MTNLGIELILQLKSKFKDSLTNICVKVLDLQIIVSLQNVVSGVGAP